MRLLTARRQRIVRGSIACVLLAGVVGLTSTPICGSVLDVDSARCCDQRACQLSASTCDHNRGVERAQSKKGCCSTAALNSASSSNAQQCCHQGQLNYPTANAQASASLAHASFVVMGVAAPWLAPFMPRMLEVSQEPLLKLPITPLYSLTAAYRI